MMTTASNEALISSTNIAVTVMKYAEWIINRSMFEPGLDAGKNESVQAVENRLVDALAKPVSISISETHMNIYGHPITSFAIEGAPEPLRLLHEIMLSEVNCPNPKDLFGSKKDKWWTNCKLNQEVYHLLDASVFINAFTRINGRLYTFFPWDNIGSRFDLLSQEDKTYFFDVLGTIKSDYMRQMNDSASQFARMVTRLEPQMHLTDRARCIANFLLGHCLFNSSFCLLIEQTSHFLSINLSEEETNSKFGQLLLSQRGDQRDKGRITRVYRYSTDRNEWQVATVTQQVNAVRILMSEVIVRSSGRDTNTTAALGPIHPIVQRTIEILNTGNAYHLPAKYSPQPNCHAEPAPKNLLFISRCLHLASILELTPRSADLPFSVWLALHMDIITVDEHLVVMQNQSTQRKPNRFGLLPLINLVREDGRHFNELLTEGQVSEHPMAQAVKHECERRMGLECLDRVLNDLLVFTKASQSLGFCQVHIPFNLCHVAEGFLYGVQQILCDTQEYIQNPTILSKVKLHFIAIAPPPLGPVRLAVKMDPLLLDAILMIMAVRAKKVDTLVMQGARLLKQVQASKTITTTPPSAIYFALALSLFYLCAGEADTWNLGPQDDWSWVAEILTKGSAHEFWTRVVGPNYKAKHAHYFKVGEGSERTLTDPIESRIHEVQCYMGHIVQHLGSGYTTTQDGNKPFVGKYAPKKDEPTKLKPATLYDLNVIYWKSTNDEYVTGSDNAFISLPLVNQICQAQLLVWQTKSVVENLSFR